MKKYLIFLLILILAQRTVFAQPVINNVSINPQLLWKGETPLISLNCYDDQDKIITNVYADIVGPGIILPRLDFTGNNLFIGDYTQFKPYLDRIGNYDVMIFCNNSDGQSESFSTSFTVSKLSGYIYSNQVGYTGDDLEISFIVKKDYDALMSGVTFNVTLNDQPKQLKIPPAYDLTKGWILKMSSPSTEGTYNLKVYAYYDRASVSNTSSIEIRKRIDFGIVSLSKNWVKGNENITISVKAKDRDSVIDVNKNNLNLQIASINLNILKIQRNGDLYDILVTTPTISSGNYDIIATLSYGNDSYYDTGTIDYIVTIEGKIVDSDNKGINTQIRFLSNNVERLSLYTDNTGYYSGSIPPDVYDIEMDFPQSTLYIDGVYINGFDNPVKYFYSTEDIVPGIRSAGLFSYEIGLDYYDVSLEMNYDERSLLDENDLVILRCSNWNSGRKICNDKWFEIGGDIDTIRNVVKLNLTSLSAFVIGERKAIDVDYNLDSDKYYVISPMKINGIVKDSNGDAVPNATVNVYIKNTGNRTNLISDSNGVFSLDLKAPLEEGVYTLALSAAKDPYISFNGSRTFEVVKSRTVEISVPDTIKLKQGQTFAQEISVINTGQADLLGLNISLTGIPTNYFNMTKSIGKLKQNEENNIYIYFSIPEDAEQKTYSATIEVSNDEIKQEKILGFTIVSKNETTVESQPSPSGTFILPKIDSNIIYIVIFATVSFSIAIILKKVKIKKSKRSDVRDFLFDVKDNFRKRRDEIMTDFKNISDYKELISSEFPNALKDKDKYGKNN